VLPGAGSGNSITMLNTQDALANLTGNGADQTVYTFTIPANTIQAGRGIRLRFSAINNNNAAVTVKIKLGATTVITFITAATATNNWNISTEMMNNAGVQNAQSWSGWFFDGATILSNYAGITSAENTANALALVVTASEANPNTIAPKKFSVEVIQ
jgi:hypothetical protein